MTMHTPFADDPNPLRLGFRPISDSDWLEATAFADELTTTLARLTAKYHSDAPKARSYRFLVGGHPVITRERSRT